MHSVWQSYCIKLCKARYDSLKIPVNVIAILLGVLQLIRYYRDPKLASLITEHCVSN